MDSVLCVKKVSLVWNDDETAVCDLYNLCAAKILRTPQQWSGRFGIKSVFLSSKLRRKCRRNRAPMQPSNGISPAEGHIQSRFLPSLKKPRTISTLIRKDQTSVSWPGSQESEEVNIKRKKGKPEDKQESLITGLILSGLLSFWDVFQGRETEVSKTTTV